MEKKPTSKKRSMRRVVSCFKSLVLVFFSCLFIYNIVDELHTTKELQNDLAAAREMASQIQSETEMLEEQKEKLQNPDYVKRYARGKLLVSQDGEQVFSLEDGE